MISKDTLQKISHMFCGDSDGFYSYKSGPRLVEFFNTNFSSTDVYGQGFPSRWAYVYDKLAEMLNKGTFDTFLNLILSKEFLMRDMSLTQVNASEHAKVVLQELNNVVQGDLYTITNVNGKYRLGKVDDDLEYIGGGGFANVYKQKSTGQIVKKLKDDFHTDKGIRSRFKREFEITKSLQDAHGIIKVYTFDEGACTYSMETAEMTLEKYVVGSSLTHDILVNCFRQILFIMTEVHKRDIIHRDISPNNIFILSGMIKIADFGLGKDLNVFTSHRTMHTNMFGQYLYCAPEQFMLLREADKRSDVYSLGRVLNFLMTQNPANSQHKYRSVAEKATNSDASYRYADATQLSAYFEKSILFQQKADSENEIFKKAQAKIFDDEVEAYIYQISDEKLSKFLLDKGSVFTDVFIEFMKRDNEHAQHLIQCVDSTFRETCKRFEDYDPFATFAHKVLMNEFSYVVYEIAANILRHVATEVNRYSAQRLVDSLIQVGIDPLLQEILET